MYKMKVCSGGHASPRKPTEKCVMKMKERKKKKNNYHVKIFVVKGRTFIRLYQKTGSTHFDQLGDIDSLNNKGTNSLVNG